MSTTAADKTAWQRHLGPGKGVEAMVAELGTGDLSGFLARNAAEDGQAPALLFPDAGGEWISHGHLEARVACTAGWLAGQGVRFGDRVLVCGHNTPSMVVGYLATLRVGAVVVLANPAYTKAELEHLVADSGAGIALAAEPGASLLVDLDVRVVSLDHPLPTAERVTVSAPTSGDLAMLAYTSGTTGRPKGVPLTHANLISSIRAAMLAWDWRREDVLVHALPLSHQHGLGGVHATLIAGSAAVILPSFDPARLADAARRHHATVLFAVPAIYQRLVEHTDSVHTLAAASLRLAISGSAPLDAELAARIEHGIGAVPLERYGSTEAGLDVSNPLDGPRLPGTVGLPLPGVQLRIAEENDQDATPGGEGEILLRGPQVFTGYWNNPSATAESFHPGGWFRTGDLGRIDPGSGYLTITGRIKELIITGGMNVYPREVELALEDHPAVAQAAVAGLPSQRWGEQVTAWVVPTSDADLDTEELIAHTHRLLAAYKCPKQVLLTESLPRNSMGKLQRQALVTAAAQPGLDTTSLDRATAKLRQAEL
jgi:malonyl-CoA/methylmalonyl-CoA synthetase